MSRSRHASHQNAVHTRQPYEVQRSGFRSKSTLHAQGRAGAPFKVVKQACAVQVHERSAKLRITAKGWQQHALHPKYDLTGTPSSVTACKSAFIVIRLTILCSLILTPAQSWQVRRRHRCDVGRSQRRRSLNWWCFHRPRLVALVSSQLFCRRNIVLKLHASGASSSICPQAALRSPSCSSSCT